MALLKEKVEQRCTYLINELMRYGYFKTPRGQQLYELSLTELELLHIEVKAQFGKFMNRGE